MTSGQLSSCHGDANFVKQQEHYAGAGVRRRSSMRTKQTHPIMRLSAQVHCRANSSQQPVRLEPMRNENSGTERNARYAYAESEGVADRLANQVHDALTDGD